MSCTQFKLFCESAREYYETFLRPGDKKLEKRKPTHAMKLGTIEHALCLEKKSIDEICRAYPTTCMKSNNTLNSKPAKEFEAKIHPLIAATDAQIDRAVAIHKSVMKSELGDVLRLNVKFEQRIYGEIAGFPTRCKPDIHSEAMALALDLKVTQRIRPDDFWRTAKQLGYFIQDAWYSLTCESKYGVPFKFRFWAIENVYPYRVQPYTYDERSREISRKYVIKKMEEYKERRATDYWDDQWSTDGVVGPWDLGENDNELVEWNEGD